MYLLPRKRITKTVERGILSSQQQTARDIRLDQV
jgi:hypothetical protein